MLQIFNNSVAGADCSAVEQKPFQKRVSPKNQRSRGNLYLCLACLLFTVGCEREGYADTTDDPNQKFEVGQEYNGGIIAWVDDSGKHGLITTKSDISTGAQWYNGYNIEIETSYDSEIGKGKHNTEKIVKQQGAGNYAAKLCSDLVEDLNYWWYLPSLEELEIFYKNRNKIGGFDTNDFYWSSTESSWYDYYYNDHPEPSESALCIHFSTGDCWWATKNYKCRVRPVSYF